MGPTNHEVKVMSVAIEKKFGSFENFKKEFKAAGLGRFGSGWAMLVKTREGDVEIITTPNQDVPNLNEVVVLLPMDVWEHAYYLKYQNKRGDYIDNFLMLSIGMKLKEDLILLIPLMILDTIFN